MKAAPELSEATLARRLKRFDAAAAPRAEAGAPAKLADRFATRLAEVATHPDRVPIRLSGSKLNGRRGATLLSAALSGGVRLMHVCGGRALCSTCRVRVREGAENLTPMRLNERISLRGHLSFGAQTRLACQTRVLGPVEVEAIFPLCGELPGERR